MNNLQLEEAVRERKEELRATVTELRQDLADAECEADRLEAEKDELKKPDTEAIRDWIKSVNLKSDSLFIHSSKCERKLTPLLDEVDRLTAENKELNEILDMQEERIRRLLDKPNQEGK